MPLPAAPFVDATTPVPRPALTPQILWPTSFGRGDNGGSDSTRFPQLPAIKARLAADPPEPLTAFVDAVKNACDHIFILDDFLFKTHEHQHQSRRSRYNQILDWLPIGLVANDVRFLTNSHEDTEEQSTILDLFKARCNEINQATTHRSGLARIEIKFSLGSDFPYVHDRFAVIDNELWHFGATVGGLHRSVTAATRGWNADLHDAISFFKNAWVGDADMPRRSRHA